MKWLILAVGTTIGGGIGWSLGRHFGIMTAFMLSMVGTAISWYYCQRFIREYLP